MSDSFSASRRPFLLALAASVVTTLPDPVPTDVADEMMRIVDTAIADRPPAQQRQIGAFCLLVNVLAVLTGGRPLARLSPARRERLLAWLDRCPIGLLRLGFWGIRTLVLMAHYGRPAVREAIGYAPPSSGAGAA